MANTQQLPTQRSYERNLSPIIGYLQNMTRPKILLRFNVEGYLLTRNDRMDSASMYILGEELVSSTPLRYAI